MINLPEIDTEEIKVLVFDFDPDLEEDVNAASAAISASVHSGTDPSPELIFVGAPQIVGRLVLQRVQGRVDQCIYKLRARGVDTDSLAHVIAALLPCKYQ